MSLWVSQAECGTAAAGFFSAIMRHCRVGSVLMKAGPRLLKSSLEIALENRTNVEYYCTSGIYDDPKMSWFGSSISSDLPVQDRR